MTAMLGFCIFTGISVALSVPPFIWHWKQRNIAPLFLTFWITVENLIHLASVIIWGGRDIMTAWSGVGFCDVAVKIMIGNFVGVCGSAAAIARFLTLVLEGSHSMTTHKGIRKNLIIDCLLSFCVPIVMMAFHYIVQPIRFILYEDLGCAIPLSADWLSLILFSIWPPIFSLIGTFYAVRVLIALWKKRRVFQTTLANSKTRINAHRFVRLLMIALLFIIFFLPINIATFISNVIQPIYGYDWTQTHMWTKMPSSVTVMRVPTEQIPMYTMILVTYYAPAVCGYLIFLFFGTGDDAMKMYCSWAKAIGLYKAGEKLGLLKRRNSFMSMGEKSNRYILKVDLESASAPSYTVTESTAGSIMSSNDADSWISSLKKDRNSSRSPSPSMHDKS